MSPGPLAYLRAQLDSLGPTLLEIDDDSARHAGHKGAAEGGHFRLRIVAACFAGKPVATRHRMVYQALGDLRTHGIHALSMTTLTPDEV